MEMRVLMLTALIIGVHSVEYEMDEGSSDRFRQGKDEFNKILQSSSLPTYGECWRNAVKNLQSGCKQLNADIQSRLAIRFLSCFRESHGLSGITCEDDEDISNCRERMDATAYSTFVAYFTHTQNMCYYLLSQVWNEETVKTISHLSSASKHVSEKLAESQVLQEELRHKQDETLEKQERLLINGNQLTTFMESSTNQIRNVFMEITSSTREHKLALGEIFSRVEKLQALVLGEFTSFYSIIYYCLAMIVSYLLTSAPRTATARFWIFTLLTMNVVLEKAVVNVTIKESQDIYAPVMSDVNDTVYQRINLCRRVSTLIAIAILMYCAWKYRDLNKLNNDLLMKVQEQNKQIVTLLQGSSSLANGFTSEKHSLVTTRNVWPNAYPVDMVDSFSNLPDHESDASDDGSEDSYDSLATDTSYHPTPTISTPVTTSQDNNRSTRVINQTGGGFSSLFLSRIGLDSPRSRSRSRTPTLQRTYNLRNRTVSPQNNFVQEESVDEFANAVRSTLRTSQRNAAHIHRLLQSDVI